MSLHKLQNRCNLVEVLDDINILLLYAHYSSALVRHNTLCHCRLECALQLLVAVFFSGPVRQQSFPRIHTDAEDVAG
ncbi:MAG: hypothetical protein PHC51_11930 [bacterium]|nr:hypothetical protein [bacterium]